MALYQVSVLKKYLKSQEDKEISKAYKKYTAYFLNPVIQENIRSSKEEQFQATFLNELFVSILGYTLNPNPNYNLTTEHKNEKNARKADGAILYNGVALAVIELKGTNTKDLESIRKQAFDYKANQKGCVYVITSNFEKLRFYINDATEFLEFNLFELTLEEFSLLYLCLFRENLVANIPLKIKEASIVVEEEITKSFYKDYSVFKRELYRDLVRRNSARIKNNRQAELDSAAPSSRDSLSEEEQAELNRLEKNIKLSLFKKSQKLIDRFLFIFFAEDRGLLPPNSTMKIVDDWNLLKNMDAVMPLYDRFKLYFNYLDKGRKGTEQRAEIYAYNGGLFKPDAILDQLEIDDELLAKHTVQLAKYDFESQVDVNILGHIFENSLNEIESVNAEIEGADFDKQKSKRKKDGVFYTPKYITKYIVENTVGKLCEEKKAALGFQEEEYFKGRKNRNKSTIENLVNILDTYRTWLLQLSICDPACGSGAFLNQALDFLIKEHRYIDELKAKLLGGGLVFSDIENTILENNIYGVDINEESVEIAKLSLWLRTAQPRRKLNDLSSTIKCGNSLIDDKKVAGDKAFKWEEEFPEVFKNGGFDVVIGNPPYLRVQGLRESFEKESIFFENCYISATGRFDIYVLFIEKAFELINLKGEASFILPHKFLISDFGNGIRKFLAENKAVKSLIKFGSEMVFGDASTYTCIINISKNNDAIKIKEIKPIEILEPFKFETASYKNLNSKNWNLRSLELENIFVKLKKQPYTIENKFKGIFQGIISGDNKAFYLSNCYEKNNLIIGYNEILKEEISIEKNICKKISNGKTIYRYGVEEKNEYIIYPYEFSGGKTILIDEINLEKSYPKCYSYFLKIKDRLSKRGSKNMKYPCWYSLWNQRNIENLESIKILTPDVCLKSSMYFDKNGLLYHNDTSYALILKNESYDNYLFYLGILNSNLCWWYLKNTSSELRGGYFRFKTNYLKPFPLPELPKNTDDFIVKIDTQLSSTNFLSSVVLNFESFLTQKFSFAKLSKKLQNWHELEFGEFIKELNKAIKASNKVREKEGLAAVPELSKKDEFEWMELFEENKKKAVALQQQIATTDSEIDRLVYELYGLTEEEITIVEKG